MALSSSFRKLKIHEKDQVTNEKENMFTLLDFFSRSSAAFWLYKTPARLTAKPHKDTLACWAYAWAVQVMSLTENAVNSQTFEAIDR